MERPPRSQYDDEWEEDPLEEPGLEVRELDDEAFRTVAEGFEQSEAQLVDNASEGYDDGTDRILRDEFDAEAEPDRAVYGEADRERSSEVEEDEDEG
jgi:hypothetical protein